MKTLIEFINEHIIKGHTTNQSKEISFEGFKKNIIKIATDLKVQYVNYNSGGKDKEKATQPLFIQERKVSDTTILDLTYMLEISDYDKKQFQQYGYNIREDSFILSICLKDDKELNRPRYYVEGFYLLLPATNSQGYKETTYSNLLKFPSKKVTDEYYDSVLSSLKDIIKCFTTNTQIMLDTYKKCRDKNKNPQKADFYKIIKKIFKDYLI